MPYNLQSKLLRVLQDGSFRPVGSNKEQKVDVRIICSTNQELDSLIDEGRFRQDLYYRLETFSISVPPLRERKDDIPLLAAHFLNRFCLQTGKKIQGFTPESMEQLNSYSFPGNVRELQNVIERAVTFCHGPKLDVEHLPTRIRQCVDTEIKKTGSSSIDMTDVLLKGYDQLPSLQEIEKKYIERVLEKVDGNKRRAAAILGVSRRTLYRHLED